MNEMVSEVFINIVSINYIRVIINVVSKPGLLFTTMFKICLLGVYWGCALSILNRILLMLLI